MIRKSCIISILIVAIVVFLTIIYANNNAKKGSESESSWVDVTPIPFGGYICGFENTSTLIQLPIVFPSEKTVNIEEISSITLIGNETKLNCSSFFLSKTSNEKNKVKLMTLFFKVNLPNKGSYIVDKLVLTLKNERVIENSISKIKFIVEENKNNAQEISMSQFRINQTEYDKFKIAFKNQTNDIISIIDISYDENIYTNLKNIKMYKDFSFSVPYENDTIIPPNEERSFYFEMIPNKEYFSNEEGVFIYMLPYLRYSINGIEKIVPSQTQATVIQTKFDSNFLSKLIRHN